MGINQLSEKLTPIGLLWLRVLTGFGIASHGFGKVFGGTISQFAEGVAEMGFPFAIFFAWMAALTEFFGGLLIASGLGTRIVAGFLFINMGVAAFIRHAPDPFGRKELALSYWAMAGAIILLGAGKWSLDYLIEKKFSKKNN